MCKLLYRLFCCQCLKDNKKDKDSKKNTRRTGKTRSSARYGTVWTQNIVQTSAEIEAMIIKRIDVDQRLYPNKIDLYKAIGKKYGIRFITDKPIGEGGFGEVYKVKEIESKTIRALKVMRLMKDEKLSEERLKAFKNEIYNLNRVSHKNIIQSVDHFMSGNNLSFILMEFASRGDLKKRLLDRQHTKRQPFIETEAKDYFVQMANAMYFVHILYNISHGDLKLENILITVDSSGKEVLKVSDFGNSRTVTFNLKKGYQMSRRATGTIDYMSPEQIRVYITVNKGRGDALKRQSKKYNPFRADIWSLGTCLYRMLYWEHPFEYERYNEVPSLVAMLDDMKKGTHPPENIANYLTDECLDMLSSLMEYHKNKRIDMNVVMRHKWIRDSPLLDQI